MHSSLALAAVIAGVALGLPAAASALAGVVGLTKVKHDSSAVNFPSDGVTAVKSPTGVTVYYVDPGSDANGNDERPIMLRYPSGRTEKIDTFGRHADVSWSPRGDRLVVTNWIGSNVADCLAVTPSPSGAQKQSMTTLLVRARLRTISEDALKGDHVYVSCNGWVSPTRVRVEVNGYGCHPRLCRPRSFDHFLIYDFRTGRLLPSHR